MSLNIIKSTCKPSYNYYKMLQVQLPTIFSYRYKRGIQKKIRLIQDREIFDKPNSLLLSEMEEESDFMMTPTPEQIKDEVEFRKLNMKKLAGTMRFKNIERKYFREYKQKIEYEENLLTWAMKEHLLNLHTLDPEIWNTETLSYAFPISQKQVGKLLKRNLRTPSEEFLKKHDAKVLENWKTLTKGKIGSIGLLKKIISKRISSVGGETLPVLPDEVTERMSNLIFTSVGDAFDEKVLSTPVNPRKHSWFKDIVEKYEKKLLVANNNDNVEIQKYDNNNNMEELQKCKNLDEIIPLCNQSSDDSKVIQIRHNFEEKISNKSNLRKNKFMTYDEYLNLKKQN